MSTHTNLYFDIYDVAHLDAAMAQITVCVRTCALFVQMLMRIHIQSIYPLIIFIFMVLDKAHHSRGPRALRESEWSELEKEGRASNLTVETDIERREMLIPFSNAKLDLDC